jgi:hypothetical protein
MDYPKITIEFLTCGEYRASAHLSVSGYHKQRIPFNMFRTPSSTTCTFHVNNGVWGEEELVGCGKDATGRCPPEGARGCRAGLVTH